MNTHKKNKMLEVINTPEGQSYVEDSLESLKADGARLTKTRKAVLTCLSQTPKPLTPSEIMNAINRDPSLQTKIDLVSVYRILKYLDDLSLVHQVGSEGAYFPCVHTNCKNETHIIINCSSCKATNEIHLPVDTSSVLLDYLKNKINFDPNPHSLEIKGTCQTCLQNDA